jgi:hypothetical protein
MQENISMIHYLMSLQSDIHKIYSDFNIDPIINKSPYIIRHILIFANQHNIPISNISSCNSILPIDFAVVLNNLEMFDLLSKDCTDIDLFVSDTNLIQIAVCHSNLELVKKLMTFHVKPRYEGQFANRLPNCPKSLIDNENAYRYNPLAIASGLFDRSHKVSNLEIVKLCIQFNCYSVFVNQNEDNSLIYKIDTLHYRTDKKKFTTSFIKGYNKPNQILFDANHLNCTDIALATGNNEIARYLISIGLEPIQTW